jgi:hypothetical protein
MTKTLVALVGTKFRGEEMVALLASLPHGEPLTLIREATNRFDPAAVQVWARGQHLGFIKSTQVRPIAARMDRKLAMDSAAAFSGTLSTKGGERPSEDGEE